MATSGMADPAAGPFARPIRSHYPVVILGAGINGCGLFRDLSAQGVDCLLVDRGDFCSGASAAPSRLIHGGIKYLETGEFRLVRESALERNLLLRNAPHYVKPLETVLPVRSVFGGIWASALRFFRRPSKLNDRGQIITKIGLTLYDLYGRHFQTMPSHRLLRGDALRREMPDLDKGIGSIGIYYEGRVTHAERLGLELVRDGLALNESSVARNYMPATGRGEGDTLLLAEEATGCTHAVRADIVVNAGGAWIDKVNAALGVDSSHMGGNKGAHVIVRNQRLLDALKGRMIYFGTRDGRVNLLYPLMGNVLIGSTDIPVADPDEAGCDEIEIRYLLGVVSEIFPDIPLGRSDVVFTYWGVRPLPRADGLDPGAVSRDHHIAEDRLPGSDTPILSLIGGKWTTFRGFSEQAADRILGRLGRARRRHTREMPIGGGRDFPQSASARQTFIADLAGRSDHARAATLFERYGTYAKVLAAALEGTDEPLPALPDYSTGEIAFLCRTEAVARLADLLFRRTDIALSGRLSRAAIEAVGGIAAAALGWDDATRDAQIAAVIREARRHGVGFEEADVMRPTG
jgi:glycerol-3-phosphate dehydrogenase